MPPFAPSADRTGARQAVVRRRLALLALAALAWSGAVVWRLIDLQVMRAEEMRAAARRQQEQVISLDARRGLLYDRNGRELAMSIEVDSVYAVPAEIDDPARTASALAPVLGLDSAASRALASKLSGDRYFVWVRRKVEPQIRAAVEALGLKGIGFAREHKRFYPHGELASHLLGWVGMDNKGMDGLELAFDARVRGTNGQVFALRDARGRRFLQATRREPVPGAGVALTLDATIQYLAERELALAMETTGAAAGTVIVMEPGSGDVLAMANQPTFNPNRPADAPAESRKNRAVVDAYEPGSTFKLVTMAAALERGLLRPSEWFDCQHGSIRVGRALIHDHKSFGTLSATQVLQQSSNVGAIKIGLRLRQDEFHDTIRGFGFGARTGIELPGEARGLVRPPREWSGVSQATLSFGQEIGVTPLQLATAVNALANGGLLVPPRLMLRELSASGDVVSEPAPRKPSRVVEQGTVATLTRMMQAVVDDGTAKPARMPGYSVAGKTGTAQKIGQDGRYSPDHFVASFVGFVPASRPALTVLVVLDEPRGSLYHGGDIAAPVFRRIALPALRYLGVPPEPDRLLEEGDEPALAAAVHARRWIDPVPLDEKERQAERQKEERIRQKRMAAQRRRSREADGRDDDEPLEPQRRPLPAASAMAAGDEVLLPDLQGHTLRRAVGYVARLGLTPRLAPSDGDPAADGVVVEQIPAAGLTVTKGSEVLLRPGRFLPQAREERQPEDRVVPAGRTGSGRRPR